MNISAQHWFCRSLQWFCDGGGQRVNGGAAPEIDGTALVLAIIIIIFGTSWLLDNRRRPKP